MLRSGAAREVSARSGRAGQSSFLGRTLGENTDASWWKMTGLMAWKIIGAASWDSLMVSLTLVVSLVAVGPRVGPRLRRFSDGQPLVQERLAEWHGQELACTHFTPAWCVHHWGVVQGAGPAVTAGPMFLGGPFRRLHRQNSAIFRFRAKMMLLHTNSINFNRL